MHFLPLEFFMVQMLTGWPPKNNYIMNSQHIFGYSVLRKLGQGSFGQVVLAEKGGQHVAIKKISKKQIIKVNKLHEPFVEKQILFKLNHYYPKLPLFVKIYDTQSDDDNVYLVLEFCSAGTLEDAVFNQKMDLSTIRHIAAKMLLTLQRLHALGAVHRDLKPSNFLLTHDGFVKLSDFGTAYAPDSFYAPEVAAKIKGIKEMSSHKEKERKISQTSQSLEQRRSTFVGTACYMSPELLTNDICGKQADIWAFGCILYQMLFKRSPFFDSSEGMVWKKIQNGELDFFQEQYKGDHQKQIAVNLIKSILVKDMGLRLGTGPQGYKNLHQHPFFKGIDWEKQLFLPLELVVSMSKQSKLQNMTMKKADKVMLSGIVKKQAFFGNYKERNLILYSTPKLEYYQTESGQKKGEILLGKDTPVGVEGKIFTITNQKKTYIFKSKNTQEWLEMIKSAIINAYY